jgi:hypothetical protein
VQRTSMLGRPYLTQSERLYSTASVVAAAPYRLASAAPEVPLVEPYRMQRLIIPRPPGWS